MAVVLNAKGTSVQSFQIGKQGPLIKNSSGIIEFRNTADTDFVDLNTAQITALASSSSYVNDVLTTETNTVAGSGFNHIKSVSDVDGTPDTVFRVQGNGLVFADGAYSGAGADYADYFEWEDKNPNNEDRVGYTVTLTASGKIKVADIGENPIGVISGRPSVAGNAAEDSWSNKFLKDEYHRYILEDGKKIINPEYNSTFLYSPRHDRVEWDAVGLVGRLPINKKQIVSSSWIKIKDISDSVEEWLVIGSSTKSHPRGPTKPHKLSYIEPIVETEDTATEWKLAELTEYYYIKMAEGFVWNNKTFDIDERALHNITSELMFQTQDFEEFPKDFTWRGYKNQDVKMKQHEFVEFARQARSYAKELRSVKVKHEKSINRKRAVKIIMKYNVTKDWPKTASDFLAEK